MLLSLPAGAWVDRRARRWPILVLTDLVRAAVLASVPLAAWLGVLSLPLLALVAMVASAAGTLFDLAFAGWVPRLLAGDRLHLANARIELARSAALVGGPALGGVLVTVLSAPIALLADAVSFIGSALIMSSVRRGEPSSLPPRPPEPIRGELAAGLRFIATQPLLIAITATAGINNLSRSIAMAVAILYLVDDAGLGPVAIGVAFALGNTGFLVGAIVSRRLTQRLGMGRTMQSGVALFGPSMLAFAVAPTALAGLAFGTMLFANGFGISVHNVNQVTVRQVLTPDWLRARVTAVTRLIIFGAIPIGTLLGGVIGELVGVRAALVVGGIGLLVGSLPYVLIRLGRLVATDLVGVAGH